MEGRRQVTEGFGPMVGGVHGGLHPLLLDAGQYSAGLNLSTRGGFVGTRPGFVKVADFGPGVFQVAGRYRLNQGDRLVCMISGKIYQVKLFESPIVFTEYSVQNTTRNKYDGNQDPPVLVEKTEVFSPDFGKDDEGEWSTRANLVKAERFFIVQDGYHQPVIIGENDDPNFARVSYQSTIGYPGTVPGDFESASFHYNDVPVATCMAYASLRIVASPRFEWEDLTGLYADNPRSGRMTIVASDPAYTDGAPESCLSFIENNFANGGGALGVPFESGFVTGLAPFRNSETVDGNGAVVVFAQDGVSALMLAYQRETWTNTLVSQMLFQGVGTYSPRSIVPVNDDLWFRRTDGLASVRYTKSQVGNSSGSLSVTPQSFEVSHRLELDSFESLPQVSMDFADNRLCVTTGGLTPGGTGFRGVVSLDAASVYSITNEAFPTFEDIWTGLDFNQLVSARHAGKDRLYMFCTRNGNVELWRIDPESRFDYPAADTPVPILSRMYTRQMTFKSSDIKAFSKCELYIRDLVGEADITLYWRSDGYELWKQCNTIQVNAEASGLPQSRHRLTLSPESENACDPASGRVLRAGASFQFCLEFRGSLKVEKAIFFADLETAVEPVRQCEEDTAEALVEGPESGVVLDDFRFTSYR